MSSDSTVCVWDRKNGDLKGIYFLIPSLYTITRLKFYSFNTYLNICMSNVNELVHLTDVFYHHRASVWGVKIQDNYLITGSMDKTISLINLQSMIVEKHFIAHEDEWGGKQ